MSPFELQAFGKLTDGLGIGFGLTDLSGTIHYANGTLRNTLGIGRLFLADDKPIHSYVAASASRDFQLALHNALVAAVDGTFEIVDEEGEVRTIRASLSHVRRDDDDDDDDSIWMLTHEVTELLETGKALHETEGSLHLLSGRLLKAQDVERRRMARDLHDTTGQELAVILLSLTHLSKGLTVPGFDPKAAISETMGMVRRVEDEIRTLSYVLHPPMLDELGLASALGWYVEGFSKRSKIHVDLDVPSTLPRLSRDKEIAIFRVVQECLSNVLRHSGSTTARIRAEARRGRLRLSVQDSGKGLPAKLQSPDDGQKVMLGVGILGMRERLQQLGGDLEIDSSPGGTKITASVPLGSEKEAAGQPFQLGEGIAESAYPHADVASDEPAVRRRILIADDHELMRRGIHNLLSAETDLEVCGEAIDGVEAVTKAAELHPDLLILDLSMPKLGGFSVAQQLHQRQPSTKILVFTNHAYNQVQGLIQTIGCEGFVSKARAGTDLVRGIRTVLAGHKFYEPEMARAQRS